MEYFKYVGSLITKDAKYLLEIKSRIDMAKAAVNMKKNFHQQIRLKFKEETSEISTCVAQLCMVLQFGHFGKQIRNTRTVLKCGAGE